MSLFSWFTSKTTTRSTHSLESSGLGPDAATVPLMPSNRLLAKTSQPSSPNSIPGSSRKAERLERREQLYSVVRDAMTRAGVLSASYKFKVLSLDTRGRQYLIMMDLSQAAAGETGRLAEIESLIAQSAKARYEILVTAVYWRLNEHVTAGLSAVKSFSGAASSRPAPLAPLSPAPLAASPPTPPVMRQPDAPLAAVAAVAAVPAAGHMPRYEPLQADEVVAFKNALASSAPSTPLVGSGEIVKSGRRNPAPAPEFENTELFETEDRASPLSGTQYGELN